MKKISFSFLCDQDPQKMPDAGNNTRHCGQCSRNIVDFTGMHTQEIAAHLKSALKPCGFMLPWQLDEVNDHLKQQRENVVRNRFNRLAKIAAVVSAPLVLQQAQAQTINPVVPENTNQQGTKTTEILVKAVDGSPLCGLELELINHKGEKTGLLKTDALGKVYLNHLMGQERFSLRNPLSGIEKNIQLGNEPVCMVWQTRLAATNPVVEIKKEHVYDFVFKLEKEEKTKRIGFTKVEIILYDSTNQQTGTLTKRTGARGQLKLKDEELKGVAYISFGFDTPKGIKTAYATLKLLEMDKTNELVIYDYERVLMGIMVE